MKRYAHPRETLIFVVLAVIFMVVLDVFILKGWRPYLPEKTGEQKQSLVVIDSTHITDMEPAAGTPLDDLKGFFPDMEGENTAADLPYPEPFFNTEEKPKLLDKVKEALALPKQSLPAPKKEKEKPKQTYKDARIAIIIDDMGMTRHDKDVIKLKAPLTLSYLPYAENLGKKTKKAASKGHQLMLHMPMEPLNAKLDLGPDPLKTQMKKGEFKAALEKALDSFEGYVGVNNHMGSKLTQDPQSMIWFMQALKARDVFFVDSKTIESSLAGQMAYSFNLPYEERDVFLDHYPDYKSVKAALEQLERKAHREGSAIAIGHPKPDTIKALKEWLPTLKDKNITLVYASDLIENPEPIKVAQAKKPLDLSLPRRPE